MKKQFGKLCLAAVLMVLLSGCIAGSVDELYTLPKLPEDYQKLQEIADRQAELEAQLEQLYQQWEELSLLLEEG